MNIAERLALHRRMAEGYHGAYERQHEQGDAVYSEEWKFADDAAYFSVYFTGGQEVPLGEIANASGASMTDGAALEARVYSAVLPDWGPLEFMCWPSDVGFVTRTRYGGHTKDGAAMSFHMIDFVLTNEDGLITRWETFCDGEEFGPVAELAVGLRGPFRNVFDYWGALSRRLQELGLSH
jgi:hypothetical protein